MGLFLFPQERHSNSTRVHHDIVARCFIQNKPLLHFELVHCGPPANKEKLSQNAWVQPNDKFSRSQGWNFGCTLDPQQDIQIDVWRFPVDYGVQKQTRLLGQVDLRLLPPTSRQNSRSNRTVLEIRQTWSRWRRYARVRDPVRLL